MMVPVIVLKSDSITIMITITITTGAVAAVLGQPVCLEEQGS
jgi:Thr operon leader peptide